VEVGKPNRIYDRLVENKNDFLGILAYSVYKRQKNAVIARFAESDKETLEVELRRFYDLCNTDTQLSYFRAEANDLAQNFTQATLKEVIDDHEKEYDSRLRAELQNLRPSFWTSVWSGVVSSFIFVLILGILVFFSWSLKQGPRQAIESIFNVKISPADVSPAASPSR
jgi:hypothetical protein